MSEDIVRTYSSTLSNSNSKNFTLQCDNDKKKWEQDHIYFITFFPAALILIGTIGNIVTYCVLKQRSYKSNVMAGALRYLAVLDTIVLWTIVLKVMLKGISDFSAFRMFSKNENLRCVVILFATECMTTTGNWLLILITITRYVHLRFPFKAHLIFTKLNYYLALTLMHVLSLASFGTWVTSLYRRMPRGPADYKSMSCFQRLTSEGVFTPAHVIFHVCAAFILPASFLFALNILIVRLLWHVEEKSQQLHRTPTHTYDHSPHRSHHIDTPVVSSAARSWRFENSTANALTQLKRQRPIDDGETVRVSDHNVCFENLTNNALTELDQQRPLGDGPTARATDDDMSLSNMPRFKSRSVDKRVQSTRFTALDFQQRPRDNFVKPDKNESEKSSKYECQSIPSGLVTRSETKRSGRSVYNNIITDRNMSHNPNAPTKASAVDREHPRDSISENVKPGKFTFDNAPVIVRLGVSSTGSGTSIKSVTSKNGRARGKSISSWISRLSEVLHQPVDPDMVPEQAGLTLHSLVVPDPPTHAFSHATEELTTCGTVRVSQTVRQRDTRIQSLTLMLMAASGVFLVLNSPFWTFQLIVRAELLDAKRTGCDAINFVSDITYLLRLAGHSFNFIFYCATGNRFRKELVAWWDSLRS